MEHRLVDRLTLSLWLVPLVFPGWNAAGEGWGGLGTLLGPEGAGDASRQHFSDWISAGFGWWGGRTSGIGPAL